MHDLAVIVVSHNHAHWLRPCLASVLERVGGAMLDVVVVDSASTDGTLALVRDDFAGVRTVSCANRGFGHANNRGLETCEARWLLFLNPDTELLDGTLAELLAAVDGRPEVGVVGVRQLRDDGELHETIRYFPGPARAWGEALGSERWPGEWARRFRERELDRSRYARETACDWTQGSFLLVRREALLAVGMFDERFFLFLEETDLCRRIRLAGWDVVHSPVMTIRHHQHSGASSQSPPLALQAALSRTIYARKHLSPAHRACYLAAMVFGVAVRALAGRPRDWRPAIRVRHVLRVARTALGRGSEPFGSLPPRALH